MCAESDVSESILYSTFRQNSAITGGGAINITDSVLRISGTAFIDNSARFGDVIQACNSEVTLDSSDGLSISEDPSRPECILYDMVSVTVPVISCMSIQSLECEKFFITRQANDLSCPGRLTGDPCITLQQFISSVHLIYIRNPTHDPNTTILEIQPGYYVTSESFVVENIDTLIIQGIDATIDCNRQSFRIRNIRSVFISGITFVQCGEDIYIDNVNQLVIENSTFQQRLRLNDIKVAEIRKSTFIDGEQMLFVSDTSIEIEQCTFENNTIGMLVEHSNVTINASLFRRNSVPLGRYLTNTVFSNIYDGGAIHMRQRFGNHGSMTLAISNSTFIDNNAQRRNSRGGAVYLTDGNITVSNIAFMNNSAASFGGAIYMNREVKSDKVEAKIFRSSFVDNHADTNGGAISISDSIQISQCSFISNTAKRGGGAVQIVRDNSSIIVAESIFDLNSASYCGVFEVDGLSHNVTLMYSLFTQNQARGDSDIESSLNARAERDDIGGFMCIRSASISVLKCNFSHNSAAGYGGVLYVDDSTVDIRASVFNNNSAGVNGGVTYTEFYRVQFNIAYSSFTKNKADGKGGVLHVGRSGSYAGVERSIFGNNTANDEGGVFIILGGSLNVNETNFYGNEAKSGGVITACHSEISVSNELIANKDDVYSVCTHYDGEIDGFNTTYVPDVITTTPTPTEATTSTPSTATSTSTLITTTSDPVPTLPDIITPLSVYFVLKSSVYLNNSVISLEEIGEEDDALICKTNSKDCCGTPPNRFGEFHYPNRDLVPIRTRAEDFYRNRGEGEIRLNRITGSTSTSGRFSCVIPDATGMTQVAYIYLL